MIVPVRQPMIWLFQMARSGGTMTLRLFDGHPDIHVHPMPMTIRWPLRGTERNLEKMRQKFSLARWNNTGWKKLASNADQTTIPIRFDQNLFDQIFDDLLPEDASPSGARARFDAACTARFNAWTNYNNLKDQKKYQLLHSAIWHHTPVEKVVDHFFQIYPDGYMLFVARNPEDWLVSLKSLESESNKPSWLNEINEYLDEYIDCYSKYMEVRSKGREERMLVLEFDNLVKNTKSELMKICNTLNINYDECMENTTSNGVLVRPNSTHRFEGKAAPDRSVIGWGKKLVEQLKDNEKFVEARQKFKQVLSYLA